MPSRRRGVFVALAMVSVLLAACGDDDSSSSDTTSTSSTTTTAVPGTTTTSSTASTATTTPQAPPPVAVSVVHAGPGGGSGEVALEWDATGGATGYKVLRSSTPEGQFAVVADIDVTTGEATAGEEVVNVWSGSHSYIPSDGPLTAPDSSPHLAYVELGGPGQRCFQVVAYTETGVAAPSDVVCASPT